MGVGGGEKHEHQEINGVSREGGKGPEVGAYVLWMGWYEVEIVGCLGERDDVPRRGNREELEAKGQRGSDDNTEAPRQSERGSLSALFEMLHGMRLIYGGS